jgi:phosphate transport system substrate-binding protein
VSRPLFFYVKKAHVGTIPGIEEYLKEFTSEKAWGPDGYLSEKGLIPMPDAERKKYAKDIKMLTPMGWPRGLQGENQTWQRIEMRL